MISIFCNFSNLFAVIFATFPTFFSADYATLRALVTIFFYFTAGPPYEKSCPGIFFFSLYGNCLSNSSTAFSSTKYPVLTRDSIKISGNQLLAEEKRCILPLIKSMIANAKLACRSESAFSSRITRSSL